MIQTIGPHNLLEVQDVFLRRQVLVQLVRLNVELDQYDDVEEAGLRGNKRDFALARTQIYGIMPQFRQVIVT